MILRKTLLYLPAGVFGPLLQVVTILVLTHWLSPQAVGLHALVTALQELLHLFALVWWSQYVLRYFAPPGDALRDTQDRTEIALLIVMVLAQSAIAAGLVAWMAGEAMSGPLVAAAALSTATRSLVTHWTMRARAEHRIGLVGIAQAGAPALGMAIMLGLFMVRTPDLTTVFVASALGNAVVAAILWPALGLRGRFGPPDPEVVRAAIRYGAYTTAGATLAWISLQSVRFTTEAMLGTVAVGLMSVGWGIGQRIAQQLAALATMAVFPIAVEKARRHDLAAGLAQISIGGTLLLAIVMPATVGTILLATPLANLLTAEPFREATATILPLAMLAGAARVVRHNYLEEVLQLAERPALVTWLDAIEAFATVLLCVLGAWWYGLVGSVIGCLVAALLTTAIAFVMMRVAPSFSVDWAGAAKVSLATAAMAAFLLWLPKPAHAGPLALCILGGASIYGLALLAVARRDLQRLMNAEAA